MNYAKMDRLPNGTTDKDWQEIFHSIQEHVSPSARKFLDENEIRKFNICGESQTESYMRFINEVLKSIRHGLTDYCFYVYQIADLLRFEPDRLMTEYIPEDRCFNVWLKRREPKEEVA